MMIQFLSVSLSQTFTVIGIPDTQNYSQSFPEIFRAQTQWVSEQQAARDIQFVSHYGDVVNCGDQLDQWANTKAALDLLDATDIPWGVSAGNHDIKPYCGGDDAYIPQFFAERYGPTKWEDEPYFLGCSPSGMSNAQIFSAGGWDFLWLHLECDVPTREMVWAQSILDQHRDRVCVLTTHRYMQDAEDYTAGVPVVPSGRFPDIWYTFEGIYAEGGNRAEDIFRWLVRRNPSICMVNCGHFHEEFRQTSTNVNGLPVHEVLADYQDDPNGGDGWLRIMEFDTELEEIRVESYSPTLDQYRTADESVCTLPISFGAYALPADRGFCAFQEGINGYVGTQDTWINEDEPNTSYGGDDTRESDDDTSNSIFTDNQGQALLRFDGMFSEDDASGTIPLGSVITQARLVLELQDDVDIPFANPDFYVHEVLVPWDEFSTWNSLGNGLSVPEDLGDRVATFLGDNDPSSDFGRSMDVTALVQRWSDGQANWGVAILPEIVTGNDDGISIWTSEASNGMIRPRLEVTFEREIEPPTRPEDLDGDGVVGVNDLILLLSAWGMTDSPFDLNGNGSVGNGDLIFLISAWG